MDIKELKDKRLELEFAIEDLLKSFSKEIEMKVDLKLECIYDDDCELGFYYVSNVLLCNDSEL